MRLPDRAAIITGASSGIGRAAACLFAKEGAKVVVNADRNVEGGEKTVQMIKEAGGEAIFVKADVSMASEAEYLVNETIEKFGSIDILYNNAGIWTAPSPVETMDEVAWNRIFSVNVNGVMLMSKYVVPEMKKAGHGVIINTDLLPKKWPKRYCDF
jgi:NAD(P)-dependent dehydrogenase (short-subunit alcohol dehydrogenase family)